jgi:hypothetical protein
MTLPALAPRSFWTRIVVSGVNLLIFLGAALIMARQHSLAGMVLVSLLVLLSLAQLVGAVARRPSRHPK